MTESSPAQTEANTTYTLIQPKTLHEVAVQNENIYEADRENSISQPWEIDDTDRPYLKHVKSLCASYPYLRVLADFMQVGTMPLRWKKLKSENRQERVSRTKVTRLDYLGSNKPDRENYTTVSDLKNALEKQGQEELPSPRRFRLFVVEDLSRDVIEMLGKHYDIDPSFFRDHIFEYMWYNTRDRWMNPPRLSAAMRQQEWLQIRFAKARYFENEISFSTGTKECEAFNVYRRIEDDLSNTGIWDANTASIGLTRSQATFWLESGLNHIEGAIGILLVDPTVKPGFPLWYGYRNWEKPPSIRDLDGRMPPPGPKRESFSDDLIYWIEQSDNLKLSSSNNPSAVFIPPIEALLCLICSEWLTLAEYLQSRLAQTEWELAFSQHFLAPGQGKEVALEKLNIWRRLVPEYHGMLTDTLQHWFSIHDHSFISLPSNGHGFWDTILGNIKPGKAFSSTDMLQSPLHDSAKIQGLQNDFSGLVTSIEEKQKRIGELTSVIVAGISIGDEKRATRETHRIGNRLQGVVTIFVPLTFLAGLFSMQDNIGQLRETMKWYFTAASGLICILLVASLIAVRISA